MNILKLYPEDFEKTSIWKEVCEVCQIPITAESCVIEFTSTGITEEDLQERKQAVKDQDE